MSSDFDDLEALIMADARQTYSEAAMDHAMNPRNAGNMADADGFGHFAGPCGDTMKIWIKVRDGKVASATFWTNGCGASIASGSVITTLAQGKTVQAAYRISGQDVLSALGGLPEDNEHCALLAATALQYAINDYQALEQGS